MRSGRDRPPFPRSTLVSTINIFAEVDIFDTLTFDLTAFAPDEIVDVAIAISIAIAIDGVFTPFQTQRRNHALFDFALTSKDDELRAANINDFADSFLNPHPFEICDTLAVGKRGVSNGPGGGLIGDWSSTPQDVFRGGLRGVFALMGGETIDVAFTMGILTSGDADFFNTATLDLQSPAAFSSASGAFIDPTAPGGPVEPGGTAAAPLPAGAALSPGALFGLALFRRRRGDG